MSDPSNYLTLSGVPGGARGFPDGFMPHGYCLLWEPDLLWLHVGSDVAIALAYFSIPIALLVVMRRRPDITFGWVIHLFSAFIVACGLTHLVRVWTLWYPDYLFEGVVKLFTGGISMTAAVLLWPIIPKLVALPDPARLAETNDRLENEIRERERAEAALLVAQNDLEQRVAERTEALTDSNRRLQVEIDDRRRAEARVREREGQMRLITDALPVLIAYVDADERYRFNNAAYAQWFGASPSTLQGRHLKDVLHPVSYEENHHQIARALAGTEVTYETEIRLPDERRVFVEATYIPEFGADGSVRGFYSLISNLTERRRAADQFQRIVEGFPTAIVTVNPDGRITLVNSRAEALFGYAREELMGRDVDDLVPARFRAGHPEKRRGFFANPSNTFVGGDREVFAARKDGSEVPVEIGLSAIDGPDGIQVLATVLDITARREAESSVATQAFELRRTNAELQRSNQELDEFAHVAAHDLREPLRGIHQYAAILEEECVGKIDDANLDRLGTVRRLAGHLDQLLDSLLTFSRVGRVNLAFAPTDLDGVLSSVIESLRANVDGAGATIEIPRPLPTVICDRVRIGEVFRNLITNALKYTDRANPRIDIGWTEEPGQSAIFFVRDDGIGISKKHMKQVFRIFKRLHGRGSYGGGSGAGLTIVERIIDRHGGRIWLESEVGAGTTFYFTLGSEARRP